MTDEEALLEFANLVPQGATERDEAYRARMERMATLVPLVKFAVGEVNKNYFIINGPVNDGVIFRIGKDAQGNTQVRPVAQRNFRASLQNKFIKYENEHGKEKKIPYADLWLQSGSRLQRSGIAFDPSGKLTSDYYNLWTGWPFKPKIGKWDLYQQLIRHGITAGEEELFDYVLNWMAHVVQKPIERMDVALCITGDEGVGKSVFGYHFGALFGQHYAQMATLARATGQFNSLIADKLLLQVDEAYVSGSKNDSLKGTLNDLITAPEMLVEYKQAEVVRFTNYLHFIMTSNNRVFVPAGTRGRRFAVLAASSTYLGDTEFFRTMDQQMHSGGYEALMYELVHRDISEFEPRNLPRTQARANQVLANIDSVEEWLRSLLRLGEWPDHVRGWHKNQSWQEFEYSIPTVEAYALYEEYWGKNSGEFIRTGKYRIREENFGKRLSELISTVQRDSGGHYAQRIRNNTAHFEMRDRAALIWAYRFPKWSDMLRELAYKKGVEPEQYIS